MNTSNKYETINLNSDIGELTTKNVLLSKTEQ